MNAFGLRDRFLAAGPASVALAVLPLKNLSGDASQDYYADGISEALITELGKIGRLQVLSFQSVSHYRQTQKPLPEIARELGVDALLEGSVVRSGDRVRITVKLFQAAPERQLLSESYEFEARDVRRRASGGGAGRRYPGSNQAYAAGAGATRDRPPRGP